ncbi:hypothetical protein JZ751_016113 [Albula glossodonta]|uniref:Cadherin EGF LAG seven-pass G-type receptor 1 n=1 Tax=Albula glossodonta TaxID=121402 RepID=A0A8T2NSZ8_9TELE|nr:hypothetical protein JZ751_016113 [Albula glossodonta]
MGGRGTDKRSLNCNNTHTEEGALYRTPIGESTVSMESTVRSGQSHSSYRAYSLRDDSGQKPSGSTSTAKAARADTEPIFHRSRKKRADSDSDSELSVDEHSSSYASSRSSDSEGDEVDVKPKWNNERQPLHSTPKVDTVSNHVKPYWPVDATTCSDSEDPSGADRLRVETKVNVELHPENKLNHIGDQPPSDKEPPSQEGAPPSQPNSNHQPEQRKGILKNKITYPPPLTDKNMKNRLREKLSDYNPPAIPSRTPSVGSNEGVRPGNGTGPHGVLIKPPQRPAVTPREQQNGVAMTLQAGGINGGNASDSDGSNETSI